MPIRANQPFPEVTFAFDLEGGDVRDYPLDRYVSVMTFSASARAPNGAEEPLPIRVTAWEGLLGFDLEGQAAQPERPGELQLEFAYPPHWGGLVLRSCNLWCHDCDGDLRPHDR